MSNDFMNLAGFDAREIDPNFGGASWFPATENPQGWLVQLVRDEGVKTGNNDSSWRELIVMGLEGPVNGVEAAMRLMLSDKAAPATRATLSALCRVTNIPTPNSTQDLMGIPFRVTSEPQMQEGKPHPAGYTQLARNPAKAFMTAQGVPAGDVGSGATQASNGGGNNAPAPGFGGGNGNGNQGDAGNGNGNGNQGQGNQASGDQGGGFGSGGGGGGGFQQKGAGGAPGWGEKR